MRAKTKCNTVRTHDRQECLKKHLRGRVSQSGAAIVEFAVILPVLLLIVFGIIDFGLLFYNDLRLTQAARDAARYYSIGTPQADAQGDGVLATAGNQTISTAVASTVTPLASVAQGAPRVVTVTGTYSWITPLPGIIPGIGGSVTFDASATMRRE